MPDSPERRRHARRAVARPAKLLDDRTGRFIPAATVNVSAGGALLRVAMPSPVTLSPRLHVAIAGSAAEAVQPRSQMRSATVVRRETDAAGQRVAVAFR